MIKKDQIEDYAVEGVFIDSLKQTGNIINPIGSNKFFTGTQVGAIKVTLPVTWNNDFITIDLTLASYQPGKLCDFKIFGSMNASAQWLRTSVINNGKSVDTDYKVRFGHDGVNCCFWIGELGDSWDNLTLSINKVIVSSGDQSTYKNNWSISLVTLFDTITTSSINNFAYSDANKLKNLTDVARTYTEQQSYSVSPIVPPATQADHVPQFGQTLAITAEIQAVWTGTQAEYDLLTPIATTLYFIQ